MSERDEVDELLRHAHDGERAAWERLLSKTYPELKRLARRQLDRSRTLPTLNTTGLVNEWYLRQETSSVAKPGDRRHYFALAAKIMRQIICGYARERAAVKRGGGATHVAVDAVDIELNREAEQFLALEQALNRLRAEDQTLVRVVECRFFAGMSEVETAEALGLSLRSVQREWSRARGELAAALES